MIAATPHTVRAGRFVLRAPQVFAPKAHILFRGDAEPRRLQDPNGVLGVIASRAPSWPAGGRDEDLVLQHLLSTEHGEAALEIQLGPRDAAGYLELLTAVMETRTS